jgi:hypothetical protein
MLPYFAMKLDIAICYNEYNISLLLCLERMSGDKGSVYLILLFRVKQAANRYCQAGRVFLFRPVADARMLAFASAHRKARQGAKFRFGFFGLARL